MKWDTNPQTLVYLSSPWHKKTSRRKTKSIQFIHQKNTQPREEDSWLGRVWLLPLILSRLHACMDAWSLQSCPTLCDPMDCTPPGSSVHAIFQARVLEWVTIPFSRYLPYPRIDLRSNGLQVDSDLIPVLNIWFSRMISS